MRVLSVCLFVCLLFSMIVVDDVGQSRDCLWLHMNSFAPFHHFVATRSVAGFRFMKKQAVHYAAEQCVQLQRRAIESFKPDVVVGAC